MGEPRLRQAPLWLVTLMTVLHPISMGQSVISAASAQKPGSVLWSADMETGDLSQWTNKGTRGGSYDSGKCIRPGNGVSTEQSHSGRYSMKLTIDTSVESGCRQFRNEESVAGQPLYYSAWFYLPGYSRARNYWNIFQFKSEAGRLNDPFWVIDLMPRKASGALHLVLRWKGAVEGPTAGETLKRTKYYEQDTANVPVRRWFHIEAFLRQASTATGRLTVWQDGLQLWDLPNVKTKYPGGDQRWSVNNYSDGITPSPATLYIDDATISVSR